MDQSSARELAPSPGTDGKVPQVQLDGRPVAYPPAKIELNRTKLEAIIDRTAKQFGVERELVRAVIAAESAYNARAVSRAGAVGLMQLMPATAADYGVSGREALFDPETNVRTGVRHLKRLLDKYGNDYGRVIMAYNAGEGVVDRTNSRVTYAETLDYTETVIGHYRSNGGIQPTEEALRKVRALRGIGNAGKARRSRKANLDRSVGRTSRRGSAGLRRLDASLYQDLADGYLDAALRTNLSTGSFDDLPQGGL